MKTMYAFVIATSLYLPCWISIDPDENIFVKVLGDLEEIMSKLKRSAMETGKECGKKKKKELDKHVEVIILWVAIGT